VQVSWPDAMRSVDAYAGIVPNYVVDLTQGDAKPKYPNVR
jgi:hypothetical protein